MMVVQPRGLAVLEIDNPPVNALAHGARAALVDDLAHALADRQVRAILIGGRGRMFSAGADVKELGKPIAEPSLASLTTLIENAAKPIIAVIRGSALGGGLELALACHFRVASHDTKLGVPEVTLGIIPGSGGTQRLPRLIGIEAALDMVVGGKPVSGTRALELGLVDATAGAGELDDAALRFAESVAAPRPTSALPVAGDLHLPFEQFEQAHARRLADLDAARAGVAAVRASVERTFPEGLAEERRLFLELVGGTQSKALRHVFAAERAAAHVAGLPESTPPRSLDRIGVVGAGTMGSGIALALLSAGLLVDLVDASQDALDRGLRLIRDRLDSDVAKHRLSPEAAQQTLARLETSLEMEAVSACDLVIEAAFEDLAVKRGIFERLDAAARPDALLATNTSYLDVDAIAAATCRPSQVLGLHFFSPANIMKLVEVVRARDTSPDAIASAMAFARRIGKLPVLSANSPGFIGNRMLVPRRSQADALLLEGATPEQIDWVHTALGLPMGPFRMADLAGVDIGWHRDPSRIGSIREALCAAGRFGQKAGAGFYDYTDGRTARPSSVTTSIVVRFRQQAGVTPRSITGHEIRARTVFTLVNEGALLLEEGVAQRESDIDVVWTAGYGWPRHSGGPMFWARTFGLDLIRAGLLQFRDRLGADFRLAAMLKGEAVASAEPVNA